MSRPRTFEPGTRAFGSESARAELDVLPNVYVEDTPDIQEALSSHCRIVTGRRGTGKTALANYLRFKTHKPYDVYVNLDTPELFTEMPNAVATLRAREEGYVVEKAAGLWELGFWSALMLQLLKERRLPEADTAIVQRFVEALAPGAPRQPPDTSYVLRAIARQPTPDARSSGDFEDARDVVVRYFAAGPRAVIVIDTIEESPLTKPAAVEALGVMLHAVTVFAEGHKGIDIKCFVPGEIFPDLVTLGKIPNLGRTLPHRVNLRWRQDDLRRLICWRYVHFLGEYYPRAAANLRGFNWTSPAEVQHIWASMFHETVMNQLERNEESFTYLIRHLQCRPRELIWVCNAVARASFQRDHFVGTEPRKFGPLDIAEGLTAVLDDIAEEALDSYKNAYPNARRIFNFLHQEHNVMPRASRLHEIASRTTSQWPTALSYTDTSLLEMAAHLGIVGRVVGETDEYYLTEFEYLTGENLNLSPGDRCAIHPMFNGIFRVRPLRDRKVVCPVGRVA